MSPFAMSSTGTVRNEVEMALKMCYPPASLFSQFFKVYLEGSGQRIQLIQIKYSSVSQIYIS